jgi:hypothetical protein
VEPVALWLNEDGLPRDGRAWEHTFDVANERIKTLGLESFSYSAHMLRHSFALKWYAIGKLVHQARLRHLTEDEWVDFREQFGDAWHLVQTMLGHARVETTQNEYLEPFKTLGAVCGLVPACCVDHEGASAAGKRLTKTVRPQRHPHAVNRGPVRRCLRADR